MQLTTLVSGGLLACVGMVGYGLSNAPTALIPLGFGLVMIALGLLARVDKWRRHAMHGAAGLALLGVMGSAKGLLQTISVLWGKMLEKPLAAHTKAAMALLCISYLFLSVRSFIRARAERSAAR